MIVKSGSVNSMTWKLIFFSFSSIKLLGNGSAASGTQRCSPEALSKLSERLGARWKQLIPKLGLPEEVEKEVEKEKQDEKGAHGFFPYFFL